MMRTLKRELVIVTLSVVLAACTQQATPSPTSTPTATPRPTPTLTPAAPLPTPTSTPEPTPSPTKTPTPIPTVTVETVGFKMEDLTPEEQRLAVELETSYRTAAENQELKEGTIYLTHGDQGGEIGGYFKDKKGFWYLVEREENKVLEEVPRLQGTTIIWNPNEVRFEYKPSGVPFNWIWRARERMVYDPVNGFNVAQWNPETSSWNMNPEPTPTPEPTNWTYIEGVEHVKFAEFNQEQLQMLKEAADLVKQYDPERFALFEREIDWVRPVIPSICDFDCYWNRTICVLPAHFETTTFPQEIQLVMLVTTIWGHEFQHRIQQMQGIESNECDPVKAQLDLARKIREGVSAEHLAWLDYRIGEWEISADRECN